MIIMLQFTLQIWQNYQRFVLICVASQKNFMKNSYPSLNYLFQHPYFSNLYLTANTKISFLIVFFWRNKKILWNFLKFFLLLLHCAHTQWRCYYCRVRISTLAKFVSSELLCRKCSRVQKSDANTLSNENLY